MHEELGTFLEKRNTDFIKPLFRFIFNFIFVAAELFDDGEVNLFAENRYFNGPTLSVLDNSQIDSPFEKLIDFKLAIGIR